jgi:hypothetical protein
LIGHDRALPTAQIDDALKANKRSFEEGNAILRLAIDYDISIDWLIAGDIRGLLRMRRPCAAW